MSLRKENRRLQDFRRLPRTISQKFLPGYFQDFPPSGCGFFAYSWKLPAYSGAFLLTVDNFSFFTYNWSFFASTVLASLLTIGAFLLTVGKSASNKSLSGL